MGIGIFGILQIGKEALFTQQSSIGVTAHNIANADTLGYSRQTPVIETMPPQKFGGIFFGSGSRLVTITKSYDKFLNNNIALETSILGRWEARETSMTRTETIFNESSELGLNYMLNEFWDAWHDVADHPEGLPERAVLQSTGESIAVNIRNMSLSLEKVRSEANDRILNNVLRINQFTLEIAQLNVQIKSAAKQTGNANDLTDKRSLRIEELSKLIDTTILEAADGDVTILTGFGKPLVSENINWRLVARPSDDLDGYYAVMHDDSGVFSDITDKIRSGSLKGAIEIRDQIIPQYLDSLDLLASSLVTEVNRIHYQGFGLDGSTANYFFNPGNFTLQADADNKGGANIYDARIIDPRLMVNGDFDVRFVSSIPQTPKYDIYDKRNEEYIYRIDAGNAAIVFDDGSGDTIVALAHGTYTGSELAVEIENQLDSNASSNQDYSVTYNETDRKFMIINKGTAANTIKWSNANTNAAEILGFYNNNDDLLASNASIESDTTAGTYTYAANLYQIKSGANDKIIFDDDGVVGGATYTATLSAGVYTAAEMATEIKNQLEAASGAAQTYSVIYSNNAQRFTITNDAGNNLDLLWLGSSAAVTLGYNQVDNIGIAAGAGAASDNSRFAERIFDVTSVNNSIVFDDGGVGDGTGGNNATAVLSAGKYSGEELAAEIEKQLESTFGAAGQDYIVTFDAQNGRFTIINLKTNTQAINLAWTDPGSTAAAMLGYAADVTLNSDGSFSDSADYRGNVATYDTVDFYGMSLKITAETSLPEYSDVFSISTVKNAARTIAMDPLTASDQEKIAAAKDIFTIDALNNTFIFDDDGDLSDGVYYRVVVPSGKYTADELAFEIERQMEQNGSGQSYAVRYDSAQMEFSISNNASNTQPLVLLWEHEDTTADFILGFKDKIFTVTQGYNDEIEFFEGSGPTQTAILNTGSYTGEEMADIVQEQLRAGGSELYTVTYDNTTRAFSITNPATSNTILNINWASLMPSSASSLGFLPAGIDTIIPGGSSTSVFAAKSILVDTTAISEFATGGPKVGDNRNALELADLKDLTVMVANTHTFDSFHNTLVAGVGSEVESTNNNIDYQKFVMEKFEQRRQSISGVSIDEEMVNLIKFQQSYAASAKLIITLDRMLETLLSIRQ